MSGLFGNLEGKAKWNSLESDPGVFTILIEKLGVKGIEVEELYDLDVLDDPDVPSIIYGLIFLYKWEGDADKNASVEQNTAAEDENDLFFAKQVIDDACPMQAILSILLNCNGIDLGPEMRKFKSETLNLSSLEKGKFIARNEFLRNAQNSFYEHHPFVENNTLASFRHEDTFHFVSVIRFGLNCFELDGLKLKPVFIGKPSEGENWCSVVKKHLLSKIMSFSENEIRFNLMTVKKDLREDLKSIIAKLSRSDIKNEKIKRDLNNNIALLNEINEKRENWEAEMIRRKHNYIPFILNLFVALSEKGKLAKSFMTKK